MGCVDGGEVSDAFSVLPRTDPKTEGVDVVDSFWVVFVFVFAGDGFASRKAVGKGRRGQGIAQLNTSVASQKSIHISKGMYVFDTPSYNGKVHDDSEKLSAMIIKTRGEFEVY